MLFLATMPSRQQLLRRNLQVRRHLHLVKPIARHYALRTQESLEDLSQVGALGLIRAAERYQRRMQTPFPAFARLHIRGAVLHYLRDLAPMVRAPRRLQEQRLRLQRYRCQMLADHQRQPSDQELMEVFCLQPEQWQKLQAMGSHWRPMLLDPQQLEACGGWQEPETEACSNDHPALLNALNALGPREREVVTGVVLEGKSLRAVGGNLACSATTAHRLLHRGLAQIRCRMTNPAFAARGC